MGSPVMAKISSLVAGILVGTGWWLYFNSLAVSQNKEVCPEGATNATHKVAGYSWLPGIMATIGFVLLNGLLWSDMKHEESSARLKARLLVVFAILLKMGAIIWVVFIMSDQFKSDDCYTFGGISLILQVAFTVVGAALMRGFTINSGDDFGL